MRPLGSAAPTRDEMADAYPPGVEHHYWTLARNHLLLRDLERYRAHRGVVLDIGCGPGIVVSYLRTRGVDCYGVDPNAPALAREQLAPWVRTTTGAFELPGDFRATVTTLLLMDVLEHIEQPVEFLAQCHAAFPRAAQVFVTLPARMEIWSPWDERYGHFRRYTLEAFQAEVDASPWQLIESRYWFRALYAAARVYQRLGGQRSESIASPRWRVLHRAVAAALIGESRCLPRRVPGSSLFAVLSR